MAQSSTHPTIMVAISKMRNVVNAATDAALIKVLRSGVIMLRFQTRDDCFKKLSEDDDDDDDTL